MALSCWPTASSAQWFSAPGLVTEGQRYGEVHPTYKQFLVVEAYPGLFDGSEMGRETEEGSLFQKISRYLEI